MTDFRELKRRALERHLKKSIAGEVRFDLPSRRLYSTDASIYQIEPLGVVIPRTTADIQAIVQIAKEHQTPIVPRGGGTSLSGQSIGPGIVVDCSKYLHRILDIDPAARLVRVEPGVILDQLNEALEPHGLQFGPDVATANRANLGGMIGNNSAGSRSIVYGKTIDHVRSLKVVLCDGNNATFGPVTREEWQRRGAGRNPEASLYRTVEHLVGQHQAEIQSRFPKILRRVSGYNLDAMLALANHEPGAPATGAGQPWHRRDACGTDRAGADALNLSHLIVGSEGTLGFVTEAELSVVKRPRARGLLVPHYDSLTAAMDSIAVCLDMRPSAVELIDQMILDLARENLGLKRQMAIVQGRPAALLMVEFSSDDSREVEDQVDRLARRLNGAAGITAMVKALDSASRDPLWSLRSSGLPLLLGVPGDRKPVTFVEDTAVPPERLPEFVTRFRELLRRHGTDGAFYGHASVGCLHIRPVLNLKEAEDVARMRHITEDVTDLVLSYGGSLSGEHGDGLARSEWNRKMFGEQIYQAFRQLKHAFDPQNLFNPGKVVDAPRMTENLRYGPDYQPAEPPVLLDYSKQEGFTRAVELCNGSGVCRKMEGGTMCPSFRATRDEKDSTRGRANALRLALSHEQPLDGMRARWVYDVLDLCLMCKACKAECPSNVDMAKLKSEFLYHYHQAHSRPLGQKLMTQIHRLYPAASKAAPLVNWFNRSRLVRWVMEKAAGLDRRRSLPPLHWSHFRRWFRRHQPDPNAGQNGKVLLLDDCFTTFNEPAIGRAAVRVLERAGYAVELAGLSCCCRPMLSKGFLAEARSLATSDALKLAPRLADGVPLLGLEPSCLLTLADDWPELVPGEHARRVADAAQLADHWLAQQLREKRCELPLTPRPGKCLLHGHCHQKALVGAAGTAALLGCVPELKVQTLDTGCCGMAGSFGYEKEHYDLSVAIAKLSLLPALAAEPEALAVAPGTSCRHQIKDLAGRKSWHPFEVIAQQLPPNVEL